MIESASNSAGAVYRVAVRCRLDFGTNGLEVTLPDERVTVIEPNSGPAVDDPIAALGAAIRAPLGGGPPLATLARPGRTVAISVCDVTRAQPRREMLTALFREMPDVRPEDVTILIATGTHRANTAAELEWMLGRDILRRYRVINHDARDASIAPPCRAHVHRRPGAAESLLARRRRPHHDRLRRAALLCRLQRRTEDGGARPGRSGHGDDAARRRADRASARGRGASPRAIRFTKTSARSRA